MRKLILFLMLLSCAAALVACNDRSDDDTPAEAEIRQYTIASHRIFALDPVSNIALPCYLVKPAGATRWQCFAERIDDFTYLPGTEYDVELAIIPIADPPADASACCYRLHRILRQQTTVSADLPEGAVCR